MALSEREQRLLDEMERRLYGTDADVVTGHGVRPNYRAIVLGTLTVVAGIAIVLAGVILSTPMIGVMGFVVSLAGVVAAMRPARSSAPGSPVSPASPRRGANGSRSTGFMDRMASRWDRRRDG